MSRTTIDIDPTVLAELKRLQRRDGKSLGRLVSELLAERLGRESPPAPEAFDWISRQMTAKLDLDDPEALRRAMAR